jgi:RNA polymerase sigma factor (sigma-70 family)
MEATRSSLLIRAQAGEARAWEDLCELYRPLIVGWLHRQSVPDGEIDDLVQEIFLAVVRSLPSFCHSGRRGAFRSWLRTIASNYSCDYWKSPARRIAAPGDGAAADALALLEDPDSPLHLTFVATRDDRVEGSWDTLESSLLATQSGAITTLKQHLARLLPPHVLSTAERDGVLSAVTLIIGNRRHTWPTFGATLPVNSRPAPAP